jgi:hypothetical protein
VRPNLPSKVSVRVLIIAVRVLMIAVRVLMIAVKALIMLPRGTDNRASCGACRAHGAVAVALLCRQNERASTACLAGAHCLCIASLYIASLPAARRVPISRCTLRLVAMEECGPCWMMYTVTTLTDGVKVALNGSHALRPEGAKRGWQPPASA